MMKRTAIAATVLAALSTPTIAKAADTNTTVKPPTPIKVPTTNTIRPRKPRF